MSRMVRGVMGALRVRGAVAPAMLARVGPARAISNGPTADRPFGAADQCGAPGSAIPGDCGAPRLPVQCRDPIRLAIDWRHPHAPHRATAARNHARPRRHLRDLPQGARLHPQQRADHAAAPEDGEGAGRARRDGLGSGKHRAAVVQAAALARRQPRARLPVLHGAHRRRRAEARRDRRTSSPRSGRTARARCTPRPSAWRSTSRSPPPPCPTT